MVWSKPANVARDVILLAHFLLVRQIRFRAHPQRHITSNATEEIKLGGYRAVAFKSRDDVKLFAKTSIPIRCCIMDLNTV